MMKALLEPTLLTTPMNPEDPGSREVQDLIDAKIRQTPTHLEGMVNKAVEATFMDAFMCSLEDIEDKRNHEMYLLMENVVTVVEGGRIQVFIGRLAARAVTQEDVFEGLDQRLSETFFDNDDIMAIFLNAYRTNQT